MTNIKIKDGPKGLKSVAYHYGGYLDARSKDGYRRYQFRAAVKEFDRLYEEKGQVTFRLVLVDGLAFTASANTAVFSQMNGEKKIGPQPGDFPIIPNTKSQTAGGIKRLILAFGTIWIIWALFSGGDDEAQKKAQEAYLQQKAQIEQQRKAEEERLAAMTPEEIAAEKAAKEKTAQEAQAQRTKLEKEAKASKLLNDVRGYEGFLAQAEQEYKTAKANEKGLDDIRQALALFEGMADSLNDARLGKEALSKEDIAYLKDIEKRLSALQQKILPGLRLAFRKRAAQLLWEHDVAVSVSGAGNTAIKFTSAMFAANANIKAVQEQIGEIVMRLRFKQTRFEWYRDADEYTYYKLATPPDAKLAQFKFRQFVDLAAGYGK